MTLHYQGNPWEGGRKNEARYGNIPLRQTHAQKETESSTHLIRTLKSELKGTL